VLCLFAGAAIRCAPPGNKPTAAQRRACRPFLEEEIERLDPRVLLCLGEVAFDTTVAALRALGCDVPRPKPKFGHGATCTIGDRLLLGSYHVSQQNTFTGRLTPAMFDAVLRSARDGVNGGGRR
jgi:uracil-DNA glycosylase